MVVEVVSMVLLYQVRSGTFTSDVTVGDLHACRVELRGSDATIPGSFEQLRNRGRVELVAQLRLLEVLREDVDAVGVTGDDVGVVVGIHETILPRSGRTFTTLRSNCFDMLVVAHAFASDGGIYEQTRFAATVPRHLSRDFTVPIVEHFTHSPKHRGCIAKRVGNSETDFDEGLGDCHVLTLPNRGGNFHSHLGFNHRLDFSESLVGDDVVGRDDIDFVVLEALHGVGVTPHVLDDFASFEVDVVLQHDTLLYQVRTQAFTASRAFRRA